MAINEAIKYYLVGICVGFTMMMCCIVAPTLSRTTDKKTFGAIVRQLWPLYFKSLSICTLICFSLIYFFEGFHISHMVITLLSSILSFICDKIIPITNLATDTGNTRKFKLLHNFSIGCTFIMLISHIVFVLY